MPPHSRIALLACAALIGLAPTRLLPAQTLDSLNVGARVRVASYESPRVTGTLIRADSTGVTIIPDGGGQVFALRLDEVLRMDASQGAIPSGEAFWRGAGTGLLVGASIGLVATALSLRADLSGSCDGCMGTMFIAPLSVVFTGVTTIVGGLIGVAGRERWRRVWPPA